MPRSLSYVQPRKRLYPFQCPKMTACPCEPVVETPPMEGAGVGRQRVNEPLHSEASQVKQNIPRSDDGRIPQVSDYGNVRTVPLITELKEIKQEGDGLLPGDALKMKLIRKLACASKKNKLIKTHSKKSVNLNTVVDKLFPILLKLVDPKAAQILQSDQAKKALDGLKKILRSKIKKPQADKQTADHIASVFVDVFKKMGRSIPENAEKILSNEILSALIRFQSGTMLGQGKNKQFWKDFGVGFKSALKVGLPIIGVAGTLLGQPEVALATGLIEGLL